MLWRDLRFREATPGPSLIGDEADRVLWHCDLAVSSGETKWFPPEYSRSRVILVSLWERFGPNERPGMRRGKIPDLHSAWESRGVAHAARSVCALGKGDLAFLMQTRSSLFTSRITQLAREDTMTRLSLFHRPNTRTNRRTYRPRIDVLEDRKLLTAGTLDTSFGGTGMVTTMIQQSSGSDAVAVQSDLKVVVAGVSYNGAYPGHFTIARYNTDGSLDTTFGNGGVVIIPLSTINDLAYSVAIQPADGKILVGGWDVVAGKKGQSTGEWAVVRLNTNGSLDTTFGAGKGYVLTSFVGRSVAYGVTALAIQSNGQIVAAGDAAGGGAAIGLVRYNADGSLDTSFGTGGEVVNTGISLQYGGQMVAIDSSGDIDIVGSSTVGSTTEMAVARYLSNGTLDASFGTGGVADILPSGAINSIARSVGLQLTGQIVVYGQGNYPTSKPPLVATLVRLNTNGSLDSTFGSGGFYTDSRISQPCGMIIQPNDEIDAVGTIRPSGTNWCVTQVLADGSSYDPSFGTNGLAVTNFNQGDQNGGLCALAPDGKIVVTGHEEASPGEFEVARFLGDSSSPSISLLSAATPATTDSLGPATIPVVLDESLLFTTANKKTGSRH
jgi:uncharacterized delta-60 repeat protein